MGAIATSTTQLDLQTLLGYGTSLLEWFLTSFGTILNFFLQNPGLFVWFIVSIAGTAFVFFRKLI